MERLTRQRAAIQDTIARAGRPLRPREVMTRARHDVPGLSLSTVYRNLRDLSERGVLATVELPGEAALYEPAGLPHHHHFRCTECQRVLDVPCDWSAHPTALPAGFTVVAHDILLTGTCDRHA